jgi:predicted ATPase/DNA-binding XRE family transcriptional regulator
MSAEDPKNITTTSRFGALLKRLRTACGLSQEALAERAGLSAQAIRAYERGTRRKPYRETVTQLADALGASPEDRKALEETIQRRGLQSDRETDASVLGQTTHNLPLRLTSFIGRHQEIREISQTLADHRLVTITGYGGVGKTSVALRVASELPTNSFDGIWLVELASLSEGSLIASTIATSMGIKLSPTEEPLHALTSNLATKKVLILLDNCEHLVEASAALTYSVLSMCPKLSILATSRQSLGIAAETVYHLQPLPVPQASSAEFVSVEIALGFDSIALFVERASATGARFDLSATNVRIVVDLVRSLDGLPLAIELAAPRLRVFSLREIELRLSQRLRILSNGSRGALPRHQTLRALIDWSYTLLTPDEKVLFARLAIFAGGWTLEAAETVCPAHPLSTPEIFDLLTFLIEKSVVVVDSTGQYARYGFLESTRVYAIEKLYDAGEYPVIATRHAKWVASLAAEVYALTWEPKALPIPTKFTAEIDNFRAGLDWGLGPDGDAEMAGYTAANLVSLWYHGNCRAEGRLRLQAALRKLELDPHRDVVGSINVALAGLSSANKKVEASARAVAFYERFRNTRQLARAYDSLAVGLMETGRANEALQYIDRCLDLFLTGSDHGTWRYAYALLDKANILRLLGQLSAAREVLASALAKLTELGDEFFILFGKIRLAEIEEAAGNTQLAIELSLEVVSMAHQFNATTLEAHVLVNLADYYLETGDAYNARETALQGLARARHVRDSEITTLAILTMALFAALQSKPKSAGRLLGYVFASLRGGGYELQAAAHQTCDRVRMLVAGALGPDAIPELLQQGARLSEEQAADEAALIESA